MPALALLLSLLLSLYAVIRDSQRGSRTTGALWVPLAWLLIIGSRYLSQWVGADAGDMTIEDYESGSPIDRGVFALLIAIGLVILIKRRAEWPALIRENKYFALWLVYCGISILWSDFQAVALKRWIKEIGSVIMVGIVLTEPDPVAALKVLIKRAAYVLIPLSIVLIKFFPELGTTYTPNGEGPFLRGVTLGKNQLGRLCLVSAVALLWSFLSLKKSKTLPNSKELRILHLLYLLMTAGILVMIDSATSLLTTMIGIGVLLGLGLPLFRNNVRYIGWAALGIVILAVTAQFTVNLFEIVVKTVGRDATLTDRIYLWLDVLNMKTPPLWGVGYDSFWLGERLAYLWDKYPWNPNEAHNGYLEVYLELGVLGLLLLAALLLSVYKRTRMLLMTHFEYGRLRMSLFVSFLAFNVTETSIKGLSFMWFVFLLTAATPGRLPQARDKSA